MNTASTKVVNVAIGVLVREEPDGPRILIARRPADAVLSGYWELPGGKIDGDESPEACLRREFQEEVGLIVRVVRALTTIEHDYPHARVRLHPYFCRSVGADAEPRDLAVAEHRWVRPSELADYRFPPANDELMGVIAQALSAPGAATSIGGA